MHFTNRFFNFVEVFELEMTQANIGENSCFYFLWLFISTFCCNENKNSNENEIQCFRIVWFGRAHDSHVQFERYELAFSYNLIANSYFSCFKKLVALSLTNFAWAKLSSAFNFHDSGSRSNSFNVTVYSTVAFGGILNASLPLSPNAYSGLITSLWNGIFNQELVWNNFQNKFRSLDNYLDFSPFPKCVNAFWTPRITSSSDISPIENVNSRSSKTRSSYDPTKWTGKVK